MLNANVSVCFVQLYVFECKHAKACGAAGAFALRKILRIESVIMPDAFSATRAWSVAKNGLIRKMLSGIIQ